MVIKLMADANILGQVTRLAAHMQSQTWCEFWAFLDVRLVNFADVGLAPRDPDSKVWQCCQEQQIFLITDNRNEDSPDSLESTIRDKRTDASLPVFTLADSDRVQQSGDYAEEIVESLFEKLLRIDTLLGTGRLYLP
jgi:hypothetical protein